MTSAHVAGQPVGAGIGLRPAHMDAVLAGQAAGRWVEIHSENFLLPAGAPRLRTLEAIRADHALSCHSVGLSLGAADGIDRHHLRRLRDFYDHIEPVMISDHLAWCGIDGVYLNDLLPLPYTDETLDVVTANVMAAQDGLGRRLLVENPSRYVAFAGSRMDEAAFMAELVRRSGCGVLLDINNIHVSACNDGADPAAALGRYLDGLPVAVIGEIHLAGFTDEGGVLVDTHSAPVDGAVWRLYETALRRLGPVPTLIEWDRDLPPIEILCREAARADALADKCLVDQYLAGEAGHVA